MLAILLLGCSHDFDLGVSTYDCEARCWVPATIVVSSQYWAEWEEPTSSCADGGVTLTYEVACVKTGQFCDNSNWGDDPAVGDASECCGGEPPPDNAPFCGEAQ
jgi:hypothetical protein